LDAYLQVMCNILVQQRTPWGYMKSRLARWLIHNVVVTWMVTESHTRSDVPYIWRRWCVGVHSWSSSPPLWYEKLQQY
jgi:hypothetical protein